MPDVRYSFEAEKLDGVVRDMGGNKVRRPPVPGRDERLVCIVSFGDMALSADSGRTDAATGAAPGPGGPRTRTG